MPRRDGRGPLGEGPLTGRGFGPCGRGYNQGRGIGRGFGNGYQAFKQSENKSLEAEREDLQKRLDDINEVLDSNK